MLVVIRDIVVYTTGLQFSYSVGIGTYKVKEVKDAVQVYQVISYWPEIYHVSPEALGLEIFFSCKLKQNPFSCNPHATLC